MNISTSIFKFVTIRNPTDEPASNSELAIQPSTPLVNSLIEIIESDAPQPEKIKAINLKLEGFIQSKSFFKTKQQLVEELSKTRPHCDKATPAMTTHPGTEPGPRLNPLYENLYDNIVVRTITKSTTNEIFKLLTTNLKSLHCELNGVKLDSKIRQRLRIVLPERLIIAFSPPKTTSSSTEPPLHTDHVALFAQLRDLTEEKRRLQTSVADYESRIDRQQISRQSSEPTDAQSARSEAGLGQAARVLPTEQSTAPKKVEPNPALNQLIATSERLRESVLEINTRITDLSHQAFQSVPSIKYARVGDRWLDVRQFDRTPPTKIEGDSIMVYANGCYLKFPFQVADLRVVEQQSVGYLPAEIAHINNTQQGELHEKVTRRLKRIETFESLITEDETFRETDTQSTEKFTLEKAASDVQSEENSLNVSTSVSGTYGVVTASVDAGYNSSQSSQSSNSASQAYAREIVQRVVDRVSNKVRKERSVKTIEEFEETVKHVIDNTKSDGPKSYVYRWLTKLSRATLKNYGKRLIFQIDVAHPSHYYLSRSITEQPVLNVPTNPKELVDREGTRLFDASKITRENYLAWADLYNAKLEQPPVETLIVSYAKEGKDGKNTVSDKISLPEGYLAKRAKFRFTLQMSGNTYDILQVLIGLNGVDYRNNNLQVNNTITFLLNDETKELPITIYHFILGYTFNLEIECELDARVFNAWQIKCYQTILDAYQDMRAEADNKMSEWNPSSFVLNPTRKRELIKTELKKGVLSKMFRCNPFWITDNYDVGKAYDPDCCKDTLNGEKVRFLETLFDWNNITYELYPYLYADKDNWAGLLGLTDDDPHFEAFLQASYATVRIPVYRDSQKETAAVNFIMNNSIANYAVVPASVQSLLEEMESATPFETDADGKLVYEYDKDGNKVPYYSTDLGIFPVPTDLVILECGVENGIKPIGFPQTDAAATDVSIPRQYSPAIIADSCPVTTVIPKGADATK